MESLLGGWESERVGVVGGGKRGSKGGRVKGWEEGRKGEGRRLGGKEEGGREGGRK